MCGEGERAAGAAEGAEGLSQQAKAASEKGQPKVDPERFRASMERLFQIYSDISGKADEVMQSRCPYKDARSRCTAQFDCRNQFFTKNPMDKPICAGSDRIDYRSAWQDGGATPFE